MHQTVKCASVGSVGDLARIARRLAEEHFNICAVGGGEATTVRDDDRGVGIITLLVEPDEDADLARLVDVLTGLPLDGGRTLAQVELHPGFDLELPDEVGALASAAELLGEDRGPGDPPINIMSALLVDVHGNWGIVSFGFADPGTRERAAARFDGTQFAVLPKHAGERRRRRVSNLVDGRVNRGDKDEELEDLDDGPGHGH